MFKYCCIMGVVLAFGVGTALSVSADMKDEIASFDGADQSNKASSFRLLPMEIKTLPGFIKAGVCGKIILAEHF